MANQYTTSYATKSQNPNSIDIPFSKSFAGHESFAFRYPWLKKGIDYVSEDPHAFQRDDAIVKFGVGKNMVRSIRHWCLATRILEETSDNQKKYLTPTDLGKRLLYNKGWDPYLEDNATLWLLHWNLVSRDAKCATWYWAFNRFYDFAFTKESMQDALVRELQTIGWQQVSLNTLKRDIDCFIRSYSIRIKKGIDEAMECPLANLNLIIQEPYSERLRFKFGPKPTLPAAIFAYCLAEFWDQMDNTRRVLELREIMRNEGSPAFAFRLDEESILTYLDDLEMITNGYMVFEDTAEVRRIVRLDDDEFDPISILEAHYGS